ncbi:unnamed protein product [Spirodela intermedia]|uniref:Uncharacterized protein n=1 Tax=Spirodela intermedia TaxID=51605 RepID=A0A7I8J820_SPIIN|nr:unnamed protein product [Spirodela intermedia]CAA6666224.1 unnamed protein product [Spirodela intermedia]
MAGSWWRRRRRFLLPLFAVLLVMFLSSASAQQLSPSQTKTLFRLQRMLEYPANRITELSITGGGGAVAHLPPHFNIDSFFTTLSRLPSLTVLSLVSLGLWGPLPAKVDRFSSLRVLNLSSNFITGGIPWEISSMETLQSLVLAGNRLNGTVPDLQSLSALEEVNLGGNRLGPEFPLLGRSVVTVVLRNNSFRAGIPPEMQFFDRLQTLDVSSNQLIGPIPPFLFSLPSIRSMDLSGNLLSGALPAKLSCGGGVRFIDISRNRLLGRLPACILSNSSATVVLYSGNCLLTGDSRLQHPTSYCNQGAIAAIMPTPRKESQPNNRLGFILGIVGGIVGAAFVLGLVLVFIMKKSSNSSGDRGSLLKPPAPEKAPPVRAPRRLPHDARHLLQSARLASAGVGLYRTFTREEVEEATCNFSPENLVLENKSQHQMYNGRLRDGSKVVVKCLRLKQRYSPQSMAQFIDVISKLRHRHLLACSATASMTIRRTPPHATAYAQVAPESGGGDRGRQGVQFLHSVTVPGVSGNDLSIETISLDETLTAKISSYNLPMASKNKNVKGGVESPFYGIEDGDLACNGAQRDEQGEKRDVYQLGLILLEIITGSPLRDFLADGPGKFRQLIDPAIEGTFAYDSLRTAAELALSCVAGDASQRPSIDDVIWNLQYAVQVQEGWATSQSGPLS